MDRDGNRSRPSAQKGVLLVFTALLLPVVFACAGLAVDLGNPNCNNKLNTRRTFMQ